MDREKVIKGLECCSAYAAKKCTNHDCPYWLSEGCCIDEMLYDAHELLKEQEEKEKDIQEAMHAEIEGGGSTWWYVCGECHTVIATKSKYCRECGRRIIWE